MKKTNGITLISLVVTIIILIIIAGISINSGKEIISQTKLENLRTNMLLIQAKAKEYVEEANFKMGISPDNTKKDSVREEVYENTAKLSKVADVSGISAPFNTTGFYVLTQETLSEWGLDKIELSDGEYYLVNFDETNEKVEVYNTKGYDSKYSLSDLEEDE